MADNIVRFRAPGYSIQRVIDSDPTLTPQDMSTSQDYLQWLLNSGMGDL